MEPQSAVLKISAVDTPTLLALDVAAPLVECAEKMETSIPACAISDWSQCPIVAAFTGACGLRTDKNKRESAVDGERSCLVLSS